MKPCWTLVCVVLIAGAGLVFAQDAGPEILAFDTSGSVTAGYRFTDVAGRRQTFNELFSLRNGFRINDFNVLGEAKKRGMFADSFTLNASGLGGDPFVGSQFTLKKNRVYDLRVNYRQSYYYWNRNDDAVQPTGLHGLTSNHDFASVRRIGSINFSAYATSNLRLIFDYSRVERRGTAMTTRTLDYFGAPSTWGGFLRANPYVVAAPLDQTDNRTTGGVAYSRHDWNLFYKAGYQSTNENINMANAVSPERSINIDDAATANELLTSANWQETRRLKSPVSEFSYNGQPLSRLRLRGGYIYYRYTGPGTIDAAFAGNARTTNASTIAPFNVTMNNDATLLEPIHVIDQGFTADILKNVLFHADYRYSRFTMNNSLELASTDSAGAHAGTEDVHWREGLQVLDLAMEFSPNKHFMFRPGLRLMKRDVHVDHDGVLDSVASRPSKLVSPLLSLYYSPTERFTLRGDVRNTTNGGPYTRISARTDFKTRWIGRYKLSKKMSVENNFTYRDANYSTTSFVNTTRSNATTVNYAVNDNYGFSGGFTYDSFLATSAITFPRGVAPLTATWRDQTISRIWEAGIDARPIKRLEIQISGNYLRTTGLGEISGELPISGPLRWPLVTGTASWDVARVGKFSLDLQRTYYIEEIVPGDNFAANILNLRWTREF